MLSSQLFVNPIGTHRPAFDGSNFANMGQDQSSQNPTSKSKVSVSKCFHKIGSTDADLSLLREENVWIGEKLAGQPQDQKPPSATSNKSEEIPDDVKYDNELLYCQACFDRGFSDSRHGGFNTRSVIKDGLKVCRLLGIPKRNAKKIIRSN